MILVIKSFCVNYSFKTMLSYSPSTYMFTMSYSLNNSISRYVMQIYIYIYLKLYSFLYHQARMPLLTTVINVMSIFIVLTYFLYSCSR